MKFLEKRSAVLVNITRIPSTKMIHKNTAMSTKAKSLVVNSKKITVKPCILCRNSHPLYKCIAFQNMSVECRKKFVTNNKLCINCLRLHYGACMSKYKCTVSGCKGLHNSLLHDSAELCFAVKNHTVGERGIESNSNPTRFEGQPEVAVLTYGNKCVLLNTFMIFVKSADGYRIKLRGLLDNASTICVLREDIARKLGFKFKSANQSITGINGITQSSKYSANIEVSNRDYTFARKVQFSILPKITDAIPVSKLNISDLNIPASIALADSNFHMPGQIDILIGSKLFFEILNPEQHYLQEGNVILQNTKFGYLVTGTLPQSQQQANCCLISEPSLDITVKKFFELESLPDDSKEITKSEEEIYCEEHFVSTYKRDKTGRFIVRLPIKENAETLLGYSKENAIKRLNGIWEKLNKNNTMGTLYKEFMNEYELLGHMEEIKNETLDKINDYIPHHSVYKPDKTSTPLRVVFDASAKTTSGFSLNSILLNGGIIQQDLFSIVSRFRKHEYAFSADIKKMYRQILVDPNQRDLQRIMWKTSADAPVKTYKLATGGAPHTLRNTALRALADEEKAEFPDAADVICNDSYMDDILSGESTLEGAKNLQTRLSQLLQRGGFELHKWVSNSPELLKDLSASSYVFDKEFQDALVKTLGMLWDPKVDFLTYKLKISDKVNFSKRDVLSEIARLYDPLGLIGPIVTKAKIFIQELWKIKLDWSEQLPPDAMEEWMNFYQKLSKVNNLKIPRCILLPATIRIEIHGFSDASEHAYAAVVYIKCFNESGQSQTRLLCSKSRVAPLKTLTIPRLELSAALLLSRLVKKVVPILQLPIHKIWMWTDSTIALAWIKTEPHKLKTFVSNRVAEIQALSKDYHWKHVSSKNNPADLISRGCNVDELLKNEMWFSGSDLQTDEYEDNQLFPDPSYRDELKCAVTLSMTECSSNFYDELFNVTNNFIKLIRIFSFIFRFINNIKAKESCNKEKYLTADEVKRSTEFLAKIAQLSEFKAEIDALKKGKGVSKTSKLKALDPFLDENSLLRVGGRLCNADLPFEAKHQIIIPTLKRLCARRGRISTLMFDNATNFKGAAAELNRFIKLICNKNETLASYFASEAIQSKFIPPRSPNFGGLWEAGIKSFKHHLYRTLVNSKITFEEFETIIIQIEGILNSRPLVPLSDNINEYEVLTPGHFIIGRPISAIPEPAILDISDNRLSRWQYTTKCVQTIWKRWKNDYLNHLQQRNKWQFEKNNVAVGCLVLLKENDLPPCKWAMARILEVIYGTDGKNAFEFDQKIQRGDCRQHEDRKKKRREGDRKPRLDDGNYNRSRQGDIELDEGNGQTSAKIYLYYVNSLMKQNTSFSKSMFFQNCYREY
ncbi:integrase catalytic domain-containing protein [Trichonephila clavipes]|nr:integrase catalytic domain-containing protein [Trichonephila clavipes]